MLNFRARRGNIRKTYVFQGLNFLFECFLLEKSGVCVYRAVLKTRRHARVWGVLGGYLGDIWRKFGGHLEEIWKKFERNLKEISRRLEGKNLVFKILVFNILVFKTAL